MRKFALITTLLLSVSPALAAEFTVVNRMQERQEFRQVRRVERQASRSHTHTCPNAGCGFLREFGIRNTWNHNLNPSHACQYCGSFQYNVSNQPVTLVVTASVPVVAAPLVRTIQVVNRTPVPLPSRPGYPVEYRIQFPGLRRANDCPNGNCPYVR